MSDLTPRPPYRPLLWPQAVFELQDLVSGDDAPVYIVGGAVRDALLGRPLKDLDLAVAHGGMTLARQIADHLKGAFFPLDSERDVGRALVETPEGRLQIDVARFRGDGLLADLLDRDFTVNAMAVALHGDVNLLIDPLGGQQDLKDRLIRRCAPHAIASDPIRALRAIRQSIQLDARIDRDTQQDVRTYGPRLLDTSPERVRDEFVNLLALSRPAAALRIADVLGLLELVIPEVGWLRSHDAWTHTLAVVEKLAQILAAISPTRSDDTAASFGLGILVMQLDRFRPRLQAHMDTVWANERPHRALLMLAALLHKATQPIQRDSTNATRKDDTNVVETRALALRLSNAEKQHLVTVVHGSMLVRELADLSALALHRLWQRLGDAGVDVCLLTLADHLATAGIALDQNNWLALVERVRIVLEAYYEQYEQVVAPPALLDGNQLMEALDLRPGPVIRELLTLIREAQVTGEVQSAENALQLAQLHLAKRRQP